jgi:hypothetical protein
MRKDGEISETMVKTRAARRGRPLPRLPDLCFGTRFVYEYVYGSLKFSTNLVGEWVVAGDGLKMEDEGKE